MHSSHNWLWLFNNLSVHLSLGSKAPFGLPRLPSLSLSVLSKTQPQEAFSHYDTSPPLRGTWYTVGATKEVTSHVAHRGIWHSAGATKSWSSVVSLSSSCRSSLICRQLPLSPLCSFVRKLTLVQFLICRRSEWKNFSKKAISWKNWRVEQNNHSILANWTEGAPSSHYLLWLLYTRVSWLVLSSLVPLCP